MNDNHENAPQTVLADEIVAKAIEAALSLAVPPSEIAVALLIGAFTLAKGNIDAVAWGAALERGAALCRDTNNSEGAH